MRKFNRSPPNMPHFRRKARSYISNMRKDVENLLNGMLLGLREVEMDHAAKAMGVSIATAYRYRKNPMEMPLKSFVGLVEHLKVPLELSVTLHEEELLEAEKLRLRLESETADQQGYRIVTTPHFTVNCELPEFTRIKFQSEYSKEHWKKEEEYIETRKARREIYISGRYKSTEIINGDAYIDFYLRRNLFEGIDEAVWKKQYNEIIETNELKHIDRSIYLRASPEIPVILCYSIGQSIIRVDDITINLSSEHFIKAEKTLIGFKEKSKYREHHDVRDFLINPLRVGA